MDSDFEKQSFAGRALALDVGTKTIGMALSDRMGWVAHPWMTLTRQGVRRDSESIFRLSQDRDIQHLIVGLPLELDGREERPARLARQIGEALGALMQLSPVYVDERYSSVEAERALLEVDMSRKRRREVIDQAAAVIILQGWLDHGDWSGINEETPPPERGGAEP